jgi:proteasome lid subunit RPN8/RPN11
MSERRIKLSSPPQPETEVEPMPLDEALRWLSPHETKVAGLVDVFLTQHAYVCCAEHAYSDLSHEVGGVLVGQVRRAESDRLYIVIEDAIQAQHTQGGPTHLTFTQDSLVQLNNELEDRFPGMQMVGWYHTHPRMDVFLSSYDTWLHESFFGKPWQVALVVEPYADRGGFFCWQSEGVLDPRHYVGFYELGDTSYESVVSWDNLEPEDEVE